MPTIKVKFSKDGLLLSDSDKRQFEIDYTNAVLAEMDEIRENYGEDRYDDIEILTGNLKANIKQSHDHFINLEVIDETEFCWPSVSVQGWDKV